MNSNSSLWVIYGGHKSMYPGNLSENYSVGKSKNKSLISCIYETEENECKNHFLHTNS